MTKNFPFGKAASYSCWRMLLGIMLSITLLPVSIVSAAYALTSQIVPDPAIVEALANKSISYWFVALALFSISSWTIVVRWLLTQLVEQRKTNAESNDKLISYMREDHSKNTVLLSKVEDSHNRLAAVLERLEPAKKQ